MNLSELGWAGIIRAALYSGIAVEAGLSEPADAEQLASSPFAHQLVRRRLVEVDGGADRPARSPSSIPDGIAQLWHGYGERAWEVIAAGAASGVDVRVGLEGRYSYFRTGASSQTTPSSSRRLWK